MDGYAEGFGDGGRRHTFLQVGTHGSVLPATGHPVQIIQLPGGGGTKIGAGVELTTDTVVKAINAKIDILMFDIVDGR